MKNSERFPPQIAEVLSKMEIIEREQYLDFFTRRTIRRTLMCHREVTLDRSAMASRISGLRLAMPSPMAPAENQSADQPLVLKSSQGAELTIRDPQIKTAFMQLANQAPRWVPFEELQTSVRKEVGRGSLVVQSQDDFQRDSRVLAETLTHAFIFGAIELHASEPATFCGNGAATSGTPESRPPSQIRSGWSLLMFRRANPSWFAGNRNNGRCRSM